MLGVEVVSGVGVEVTREIGVDVILGVGVAVTLGVGILMFGLGTLPKPPGLEGTLILGL
jgi:CBS-domain-containing membrane protein